MSECIDSPADDYSSTIQNRHQGQASGSRSSASSTSTQWPSTPSSPGTQTQDVSRLQDILDRALHDPFSSHPDTTSRLKSDIDNACQRAAEKIFDADVLLVITGAGFSADSGLATFVDVADIDAYRDRGWRYRDLCVPPTFADFSRFITDERGNRVKNTPPNPIDGQGQPKISLHGNDEICDTECKNESDSANSSENRNDDEWYPEALPGEGDINHPQYFYGFWNQCCNDYRRVNPHEGYEIIARWGKDKNSDQAAGIKDNVTSSSNNYQGSVTNVARAISTITSMLEQRGVNDSDSSDDGDFHNVKVDDEEESYYVSPTERAGAFFVFTSNIDAHSYDVFRSHEIRECHGNVELWQCHNFACGTNATVDDGVSLDGIVTASAEAAAGGDGDGDGDGDGGGGDIEPKWQRRLWRLPLRHQFSVDCKTMRAPYSKSLETTMERSTDVKAAASSSSLRASKRRKSSLRGDCRKSNTNSDSETNASSNDCNHGNFDINTAVVLGGIMNDALRNHLKVNINATQSCDDSYGRINDARVGDVRGKTRLFPLLHMNLPPTDTINIDDTMVQNYFLPISEDENWPKCPRCFEAARPAVLMFDDLDWVNNSKQEKRWQMWCESLLILSKQRCREAGYGDKDSDSSSTLSDTNMSENGWEDVSEEEASETSLEQEINQTRKAGNDPQREGDTNPVAFGLERCGPPMSTSTSTVSSQPHAAASSSSTPQSSNEPSSRLKVAIIEIGCGYNVPTCRRTAEGLLVRLSMRGSVATLIRINVSHPEPDDDNIKDFVISIMEKGLVALKLIDDHYCELVKHRSLNQD